VRDGHALPSISLPSCKVSHICSLPLLSYAYNVIFCVCVCVCLYYVCNHMRIYVTGYTSQTFSSLKSIQLCSTLIVRNVYTSDKRYTFDVMSIHVLSHTQSDVLPLSLLAYICVTLTLTLTLTHTHTHTDTSSRYAVSRAKGKEVG